MQLQSLSQSQDIPVHNLVGSEWVTQLIIKKIRVITLKQMAEQQLTEISQNKTYLKKFNEDFKVRYFQIQIQDKYKTWRIIKRLSQFLLLEQYLQQKQNRKIPIIPIRDESDIQNDTIAEQLLQFLEILLIKLSMDVEIQIQENFKRFIESLVPAERSKMKIYKQMTLNKKAGGRFNDSTFKKLTRSFSSWSEKFFTICSQGVFYSDKKTGNQTIEQSISFSTDFKIQYGLQKTGSLFEIRIICSHRILTINAYSIYRFVSFLYFLRKAMTESDQMRQHRFSSFAQIRQKCTAKYFIDGKYYFADMHDALMSATKQIFITGWMISPYFCLKRPDPQQETRLDKVLKRVANNGIKISIIVYMEPTVALNIDSEFTQDYLSSLSQNIKVLRHPAYLLIPFLWSHHEKMVIIDQQIAFMGGLDLGYGRMDDSLHLLNDEQGSLWPGVDYCNYRKTDILKPKKYFQSSIDRKEIPRMPWHDITVKLQGSAAIDLSRHFVQYWNYVNFQLSMDQRELLLYAGYTEDIQNSNSDTVSIFKPGKDPLKASFAVNMNDDDPEHIFTLPRISMIPNQQMLFYAGHIQDISSTKKINNLLKQLTPTKLFMENRRAINFDQLIVTKGREIEFTVKGKENHQILRSASMWGLGLQEGTQEKSILNAYLDLIENSKEFIYIENQFFISVKNTVSTSIKNRIKKAYKNNQKFRIIIIVPFLPGFDGEPEDNTSAVFRIQIHLMYQTICRCPTSIMQELGSEIGFDNVAKYIKFFCPRTHGIINNRPVTEIIYVHSKCMIIDDRFVLIGSANINDRSLLGVRDSEIAVVIEDQTILEKEFRNGTQREVRKFAYSLRRDLFMQHFGLTEKEVEDYLDDSFWSLITKNAERNQKIYRQIFGCYPDSHIKKYGDIQALLQQSSLDQYDTLKDKIIGNVCPLQQDFLKDQDLTIKPGQKQFFLPFINFT